MLDRGTGRDLRSGRERRSADDLGLISGNRDPAGEDPRRRGDQPGDRRVPDPRRAEDRRLCPGPARPQPRRPVRPDPAAGRRGEDAPQGGRHPRLRRQAGLHPRPGDRDHRGDDRLRRRAVRAGRGNGPEPHPRGSATRDPSGSTSRSPRASTSGSSTSSRDRQPGCLRRDPGRAGRRTTSIRSWAASGRAPSSSATRSRWACRSSGWS